MAATEDPEPRLRRWELHRQSCWRAEHIEAAFEDMTAGHRHAWSASG